MATTIKESGYSYEPGADYTFYVAGYRFGFSDTQVVSHDGVEVYTDTAIRLGPLGQFYRMPVSAATAFWIVVVAVLVAASLTALFVVRRVRLARRKKMVVGE